MPSTCVSVHEILKVLGEDAIVFGSTDLDISHVSSLKNAKTGSLVWSGTQPGGIEDLLESGSATVFILPRPAPDDLAIPPGKAVIFVNDSRLAAITILARFFRNRPSWGRHPGAVVHPQAEIHPDTYIGPNTFVGKCTVGKGCILYGNNYLYDGVKLANDVTLHAGTVIGADGFGYQAGSEKEWLKFEHVGGVEIGNGVEVGANTCIDRGALGNTVIGDGTKIDNLVHIAHNVQVGRHCLIIAHAMIGGSSVIGDYAWIAPNAGIIQKTRVGPDATVGLGAVVLEDIPPGETWAGVPARKIGHSNKNPEQST